VALEGWSEFESDLIRLRTREGMKIAKAKGVDPAGRQLVR